MGLAHKNNLTTEYGVEITASLYFEIDLIEVQFLQIPNIVSVLTFPEWTAMMLLVQPILLKQLEAQ